MRPSVPFLQRIKIWPEGVFPFEHSIIFSFCVAFVLAQCVPIHGASFNYTVQDADLQCQSSSGLSSTPVSIDIPCIYSGGYTFSSAEGRLSASADYTSLAGRVEWDGYTTTAGTLINFIGGPLTLANSIDSITVAGGVGTGTLRLSYYLSGDRIAGHRSISTARLFVQSPGGGDIIWDEGWLIQEIPFTFGVSFTINAALYVFVNGDGFPYSPSTHFSGISDYSHTAALQPFHVFDQNGAPVAGATVTSSTFQYQVDDPVPEPSSMAMLGLGLAALLYTHQARRRFFPAPRSARTARTASSTVL